RPSFLDGRDAHPTNLWKLFNSHSLLTLILDWRLSKGTPTACVPVGVRNVGSIMYSITLTCIGLNPFFLNLPDR
ncbi:hypothetical protein QUB09_14650, partial [Microcoleus sp. C2C6]